MSKKLNKGILTAVGELYFEQMTPVQVKSHFIARYCVQSSNTLTLCTLLTCLANLPNRYSSVCWRPVTHAQTWASY